MAAARLTSAPIQSTGGDDKRREGKGRKRKKRGWSATTQHDGFLLRLAIRQRGGKNRKAVQTL